MYLKRVAGGLAGAAPGSALVYAVVLAITGNRATAPDSSVDPTWLTTSNRCRTAV
jgi:hypothetical protein